MRILPGGRTFQHTGGTEKQLLFSVWRDTKNIISGLPPDLPVGFNRIDHFLVALLHAFQEGIRRRRKEWEKAENCFRSVSKMYASSGLPLVRIGTSSVAAAAAHRVHID